MLYEGKLESAYSLKRENLPSSLFKYEKVTNNRIDSIRNMALFYSAPDSFNDKYDTKSIYYSNAFLKSIEERFGESPEEFCKIFDAILDDYYKYCGIACLTEDRDNYPMWWSYADNHKGFCVEYDIASLVKENPKETNDLHPVIYLEKKFNFDNLLVSLTENIEAGEPLVIPAMVIFHILLGTMKHISWSYEKEWRFIKILQQGRVNNPAKIKAIYLGCNFDTQNIGYLEDIADEQNFNIFQLSPSGHTQKSFSFIEKPIREH